MLRITKDLGSVHVPGHGWRAPRHFPRFSRCTRLREVAETCFVALVAPEKKSTGMLDLDLWELHASFWPLFGPCEAPFQGLLRL